MVIFHSYVSLPEGNPSKKPSSQWRVEEIRQWVVWVNHGFDTACRLFFILSSAQNAENCGWFPDLVHIGLL